MSWKGTASPKLAGSKKICSSAWMNSRIRYAPCLEKLVAAVRLPASGARDEDVREVIHMAGRLECGFRKNRRGVDQVVVVAQTEEGLDPAVLPTSPKEDAIVPVVVEACEAAIQ